MFSLNRAQIIGYQTQGLTVRQTPQGTSVVDLNLVAPYRFRSDGGEMLDGKSFHVVTLWGAMAQFAGNYVKPGSHIFIAGRLQTDSWEDEKSGEKRSKTKIVATDVILLDPREGQMAAPERSASLVSGLNRADIVGNTTRDPELRTTTSGQHVMTLGVATNEKWKDKASGQDRERTEFHNVVVWGALAEEIAASVKKGNRVFVSGRIQNRTWETQAGAKRTTTEIVADSVLLLGVKNRVAQEALEPSSGLDRRAPTGPAPEPSSAGAPPEEASVPSIQYQSEVKVEDLPF